jgi:TatD DNase family protein
VVFHCFSEQTEELNEIKSRGGFASFTAMAFYDRNQNIRSALKMQGLDRLMLETDSPYLPFEKGSKKVNEPKTIPMIGESISKLFGVSSHEIMKNSCELTEAFFNL